MNVAKAKMFVSKHRVALAVTATLVVGVAFQVAKAKQWNEFLAEHNLVDAFYNTGE